MSENDFSGMTNDHKYNDQSAAVDVNTLDQYVFMDYAFSGTGGFRDGTFLVPHTSERFYTPRRKLAFYKNFVQPIISATIDPVFSDDIPRKINGDSIYNIDHPYSVFCRDCDNGGQSLQEFMSQTMLKAQLHSVTFVVMDNFGPDEIPRTLAEASATRRMPYIYNQPAWTVVDHQIDPFGRLISIAFEDEPLVVEMDGKKKTLKRTRTYTSSNIIIERESEREGQPPVIEQKAAHGLGVVPVIPVIMGNRTDRRSLLVEPKFYDLAKINHTIFNVDTEVRWLERCQNFSLLYLQGMQPSDFETGPTNVLFIPEGVSMSPGYLSPDVGVQAQMREHAAELREDLYRIAQQNGVVGVKQALSGVSRSYDFVAHENVLKRTAVKSAALEYATADLYKRYTGIQFTYQVEYQTDFAPTTTTEEINLLEKVYGFEGLPVAMQVAVLRRLADVMFYDNDRDHDMITEELNKILTSDPNPEEEEV